MEDLNISLIFERLKQSLNVATDKAIGELLNIPKKNIANWKSRNSMPIDVLFDIAKQNQISADWLLFGKKTQELNLDAKMALMAFENLDDKHKLEAIAFMSGLKERSPAAVSASGANSRAVGRDDHSQNIYGNVNEVNGFKK